MKYTFAVSAIVASTFAVAIPGDVDTWNVIAPATSKRDLAKTSWDPPPNLVSPLKQVWDHLMATVPGMIDYKNLAYDQIIAAKGKINYCVRWEGNAKVTAAQRAQWVNVLKQIEGWSYDTVDVNVVGWAVNDISILEGDVSNIDVYTDKDPDGVPQCAESCGRFFHQDGDYSRCAKGAARHYDESLWLTPGFVGGAGSDWGARVGQEYFMENCEKGDLHILLHEYGHTFGLLDFYVWAPTGVTNFLMKSGSSMIITEFDAWMARNMWRHVKARRGW